MKVMEDVESRPHKALSFVVERDRPKVLLSYSGGRLPGRSTEEAGEEEKEEKDKNGETKKWLQNVSVHDGEKDDVQRPFKQSFMRSWDCSQIVSEEEKESWRERDPNGSTVG